MIPVALNYDSNLKFWLDTVYLNFSAFLITFDRASLYIEKFLVSLVQGAAFEICSSSSTLFFTSIVFTITTISEICWWGITQLPRRSCFCKVQSQEIS